MPGEQISNKWITAKKAGKGAMGVGGAAISAAQSYSGVSAVALATGAAAASATGIGLVVTGAAVTVATCGLSGYSSYKSQKHLEVLEAIHARRNAYPCHGLGGVADRKEHRHLANEVLPYIILQKNEKVIRKGVSAIPVLGSGAMAIYGLGRAIYKSAKGAKGVERGAMATDLTRHLLSHDCALAQAIVAELYSYEEMLWLLEQPSGDVVKLLMRKMASN